MKETGTARGSTITYKLIVLALVHLRIEPMEVEGSCSHGQGLYAQLIAAFEEELDGQRSIVDSGTVPEMFVCQFRPSTGVVHVLH